MDAGLEAAPEINGEFVRLPVGASGLNTFA
jgi:hypothetical protein